MKRISTFFILIASIYTQAQEPYYDNIDLKLRGVALKTELTSLITKTHTRNLSYSQVWDAIKVTDIDPTNPTRVILLYGYNKTSTGNDAYYGLKNNNGGDAGQWNREHTYAKSLGNPPLGTSGPGADAHHLRASDVKRNADRGNLKFIDGNGTSKKVGSGWYPGDEWKGDVARMMMYMYVRYETRTLPANVGFGSTTQTPDGMIDLFLKWNAEDPVSEIETQRNAYLGDSSKPYAQGNRNPFIDNPYLATLIWGGPIADNTWKSLSTTENYLEKNHGAKAYTKKNNILITTSNSIKSVHVFNSFGQSVRSLDNTKNLKTIELKGFEKGIYILKINGENYSTNLRVIIH